MPILDTGCGQASSRSVEGDIRISDIYQVTPSPGTAMTAGFNGSESPISFTSALMGEARINAYIDRIAIEG